MFKQNKRVWHAVLSTESHIRLSLLWKPFFWGTAKLCLNSDEAQIFLSDYRILEAVAGYSPSLIQRTSRYWKLKRACSS